MTMNHEKVRSPKQKHLFSGFNLSILWFGASISIAEIMTGSLLAPLGFINGLIIILLGHLLGTSILVLGGYMGKKESLPAIKLTEKTFGQYGTSLFSILNILQLIGWTAIMIISGAQSLNILSQTLWAFDNFYVWTLIIGLLICLWVAIGNEILKKINLIAVLLLLGLTIVLSNVVFNHAELFTSNIQNTLSIGTAIELNIIMPLSWLPLIADYTRNAKTKKGAVLGSGIGYFIGSSWMYIIGLGSAIVFSNANIGSIMIAANLGVVALFIISLSTITTTFLDAYSAGITSLNILPNIGEKKATIFMALIGLIVALFFPITQYESFLYAIGSVFAPLFSIVFADYFIIKKSKCTLAQESRCDLHVGAILIWIIGVFLYYQLVNLDLILGTTIPVMLLTSALYILSWRWISNWKYSKEMKKSYQS